MIQKGHCPYGLGVVSFFSFYNFSFIDKKSKESNRVTNPVALFVLVLKTKPCLALWFVGLTFNKIPKISNIYVLQM